MVCPDCLSGHVRTETPTGNVAKIHGRDTYIASPAAGVKPKGLIVIISDLFGWEFVNTRLLADQYAAKGDFLVYLPDFMSGPAVPVWITDVLPKVMSSATLGDWVWKPWYASQIMFYVFPWIFTNRWSVSWPIVRSFFEAVRSHEGSSLSIGAAGFCWGGKHAIFLTHVDSVTFADADGGKKPLVDAIFIAHPSVVTYPDDVEKVAKPASMAIGDQDMSVTMAQVGLTQKVWAEKRDVMETEVVVYPGANHGFSNRVDHFNENLLKQARDAEDQAISWFAKHLKR
ncbi:dienelactone hydrolase family protein [Podospora didyma]|uniref:Dienelactone hydrolase family protein n=1 Tax=Podospora didyma TaxID=330526 RepID=A0AAE0K2U7_9PEZI|nr:dienelactone hydrolase family protein [Podospora didyma]